MSITRTTEPSSSSKLSPEISTKNTRTSRRFAKLGPAIALLVLIVFFSILNPSSFMTGENALTILNQAAVPLILAMGMTFVVLLGSVDLSVEGIMAAAGISFVLLSKNNSNENDLGFWALVIALGIGLVFGLISGTIHNRLRIPSFILTLGIWYVGLGIATILYGDAATTLDSSPLVDWIAGNSMGISNGFWIAFGLLIVAVVLAQYTKFGRYTYAIGDSQEVAKLAGIDVNRYKTLVFAFAGLCAALAGIVGSVKLGAGIVEVGTGQLFFTLTAVVVGGTVLSGGSGGVIRSAVAVILLTVLNNGLVISGVDPSIQQAIFGVVIVVAVIVASIRSRSVLKVVK